MQSYDLLDELDSEDKFRKDIKYSRQLPEMFSTEDINAASENITYEIGRASCRERVYVLV